MQRNRTEGGYTLIEFMVVVLIIAILVAIAIPTFLGARARAQDRAAQSDLRNGLTAEKTVYANNHQYDATTTNLQKVDPSLNWNGASTQKPALSVEVGKTTTANDTLCLTETSKSGTVFSIGDVSSGKYAGTYYNRGDQCTVVGATLTGEWNNSW